MDGLFTGASAGTLRTLAQAFRNGRLTATASGLTISRACPCPDHVVAGLTRLLSEGMSPSHLPLLLDARADAVEAHGNSHCVELVWTGPEVGTSFSRDTRVVVRELFESAQRSVLVSTFVIQANRAVFAALAKRMEEVPELQARVFLNVAREGRDKRHESELLREFADRFRKDWPGSRNPHVFYDPRGLAMRKEERAIWHAKCVLIDDQTSFVSSANLTEPGQSKNVEAGVIVRDCHFTEQLRAQFDGLVHAKQVARLPGF